MNGIENDFCFFSSTFFIVFLYSLPLLFRRFVVYNILLNYMI